VVGLVRLPASILSNNGGRVVSNNGGNLISDQGGAVLSNNGATLISDQGGSVISNNGGSVVSNNGGGVVSNGGGRYRLRQALAAGGGQDLVAIANAQVGLFDARGQAVRDASGAPLVTTTDAEGRYAFPTAPQDRALVAVVQLAGTAGQAAALVPKAGGEVAIDLASSVLTSYVISRFARTQSDPQASLEQLPAALAARAREATAQALAQGSGLDRLDGGAAVRTVEALRASVGAVDLLYEEVRRAMVIAGQANLGEGQLALSAYVSLGGARRTAAGRWWLLDNDASRLWEVVDGRLGVLAGSGVEATRAPRDGDLARETAFGRLVSVREGPGGAPWLLHTAASADYSGVTYSLLQLGPGGRLDGLWSQALSFQPVPDDFWQLVDFCPLGGGQALIIGSNRVVAVGGAPEHPVDLARSEVMAADRRPDGRIRLAVQHYGWVGKEFTRTWRLWALQPGALATALPAPPEPHWYGFDDAGHLVTGTAQGELAFYPPDGGPALRLGQAVTAAWPNELRPLPRSGIYPRLRFGGDVRTTGWVCNATKLSTFGPDGRLVAVVAGPGEAASPGEGPTALSYPMHAAMDAGGSLYIIDRYDTLLRVVDGRAEPVAGRSLEGSPVPRRVPGDPFAYTLELRDPNGVAQGTVPGFGAGYAVPAAEAYFADAAALRVAPDGSMWVLDSSFFGTNDTDGNMLLLAESFVRRVAGGRVETVAVKSSLDRAPWLDMAPAAEGEAVVLSSGEDHVKLLRVKGTQPPVELVRVAHSDPPEACDGCQNDGMAPLPSGAWLLRVQGVLWRWEPGKAAVRIGVDGVATDASVSYGTMMAASADGKVALADERRVYRLDLATGKATPVVGRGTANLAGSTPDTSLLNITGLAVAPNGDLLITDDEARQVKRVPAAAW
jgi:hypothetical protein